MPYFCQSCMKHRQGEPASFTPAGRPVCGGCKKRFDALQKKPSITKNAAKNAQKSYILGTAKIPG